MQRNAKQQRNNMRNTLATLVMTRPTQQQQQRNEKQSNARNAKQQQQSNNETKRNNMRNETKRNTMQCAQHFATTTKQSATTCATLCNNMQRNNVQRIATKRNKKTGCATYARDTTCNLWFATCKLFAGGHGGHAAQNVIF
tara:strand:+ start:100 stop:522 length:423 start_codon:yes stop_codon:yes gene_type:complete